MISSSRVRCCVDRMISRSKSLWSTSASRGRVNRAVPFSFINVHSVQKSCVHVPFWRSDGSFSHEKVAEPPHYKRYGALSPKAYELIDLIGVQPPAVNGQQQTQRQPPKGPTMLRRNPGCCPHHLKPPRLSVGMFRRGARGLARYLR